MNEMKINNKDYSYQTKIYNSELNKKNLTPYPVVQNLNEWINDEVAPLKNVRSIRWLSEVYFHRQELRSAFIDNSLFFTPADGIITNMHEKINANDNLVEIKGVNFTLKDLFQDETLEGDFMTVVVFMTFYSQHLNYIPYSGVRTYEELPPLSTYNVPMLAMEKSLLKGVVNPEFEVPYLKKNGREISTIYSPKIDLEYYLIRIGDYDVDTLVNFTQRDGDDSKPYTQNDCFGKIQYGSSTVLAIPLREGGLKMKFRPECKIGNSVKCRRTPLVQVNWNDTYKKGEVSEVKEDF